MIVLFIGLMFCGTLALGISDVFTKKYLKDGLNDQAFLAITLFFAGMLILPIFIFTGIPEIKNGFWFAATVTIILNLISQNLFIRAFKLSDASIIAPLRLIIPPIVVLTGFLFLNERPSLAGTIGIFVTMIGLGFLLGAGKGWYREGRKPWIKDRGVAYGFIGSVLFAISFPFDKITVVKSSALFATFLVFTLLGFFTFAINSIRDRKFAAKTAESFTQNFKENMIVSALISIGVILTNQALNYSFAAYASSLKRLQALWTVIIAGKFLEEKEIKRRIIATVIMLFGILLSVFWK